MPHCDEDANRPTDEAGCPGEVALQLYFDFAANDPCRLEVCYSDARAVSGVNYGLRAVREGKVHGCTVHVAVAMGRLAPFSATQPCLLPSEPLMEVAATSRVSEPSQPSNAALR